MITIWDDVVFPLSAAYGAAGGPEWRTEIETLASGDEAVNQVWSRPRRRWRVSVGRRRVEDLLALDAFFEVTPGRAVGFRFFDPLLHSTAGYDAAPTPVDAGLGTVSAATTFRLALTRSVGARTAVRRVFRPIAGTVRLAVGGVELAGSAFTLDAATGRGTFTAPQTGALTWGGRFHFAARLDADRLQTSLEGFRSGTAATLDLVEIRERDPA